jgi:hypothetical protein
MITFDYIELFFCAGPEKKRISFPPLPPIFPAARTSNKGGERLTGVPYQW